MGRQVSHYHRVRSTRYWIRWLRRIRRYVMVLLALAALPLLVGCANRRVPTAAPAHPNETHVLAETQRFARVLGFKVEGVITTRPYMVPASKPLYDGELVPAAGRWVAGWIEYYRPVVQERTQVYLTQLAAHEVAHAWRRDKHSDGKAAEDRADACARLLVAGEGCPR